jgi:hypothetical protein
MKPCALCGKKPYEDGDDTLYPTGRWREDNGFRHYLLPDDPREHFGRVWTMHCPTVYGGCGMEISGDSKEEAIEKWNRRPE